LALCSEEMRKLVAVVEHTEVVTDLHKEIAVWEGAMGDLLGLFGDRISAKERFVHTHD